MLNSGFFPDFKSVSDNKASTAPLLECLKPRALTPSADGVGQHELVLTAGGDAKWCSRFARDSLAISYKAKSSLTV